MDMSGMDSSSMMNMTGTMMMKPYLHFTPGDIVLFSSLAPSSGGAMFGACLVFFVLGMASRAIAMLGRKVEQRNRLRSRTLLNHFTPSDASSDAENKEIRQSPKFILSHELSRAGVVGLSTLMHYLLMLIVMTFNAGFIIAIVAGVVAGEIGFGRLGRN